MMLNSIIMLCQEQDLLVILNEELARRRGNQMLRKRKGVYALFGSKK